jgi:hypothetical protein
MTLCLLITVAIITRLKYRLPAAALTPLPVFQHRHEVLIVLPLFLNLNWLFLEEQEQKETQQANYRESQEYSRPAEEGKKDVGDQ